MTRQELQERYHLNRYLILWGAFSGRFVQKLWNEKALAGFHQLCRRNLNIVHSNRQRMNYSANEYQRIFLDLFYNVEGRKFYLFGSGNYTKKFLSRFGKECEIIGILDNNPDKWGTQMGGIPVLSPEIVGDLQPDEYKVIICIKNYIPVLK